MTTPGQKISQISTTNSSSNSDFIIVSQTAGAITTTRKISKANFLSSVSVPEWTEISANTVAVSGQKLICNSANGSFNVSLPANGGILSIRDKAGSFGNNAVTLLGNGKTIAANTSLTLNAAGYQLDLNSSGNTWNYTLDYIYGA